MEGQAASKTKEVKQWSLAHKGINIDAFIQKKPAVLKLKFNLPLKTDGHRMPPFVLDLPLPLPDKINVLLPGCKVIIQFTKFNEICCFLHDKSLLGPDKMRELGRIGNVFWGLWSRDINDKAYVTVFQKYDDEENKAYSVGANGVVVENEAFIVLKYHRYTCDTTTMTSPSRGEEIPARKDSIHSS
ncbi:hypothetical protein BWQ96_05439 [Gracilariopsis chorda]|uniref:Uncharacterized protein n=1 Tax=Gracilariopsis chorda TaxID=448386 RepID=A0A2V3IRN9_9FLOR|nr:hypothetical protein BWQ96_05439 [Gracilariopsis chorda]|eukprot:PXF44769.1 hypothetical protein BWQ96_05439 [Gracilariopsis chorda]